MDLQVTHLRTLQAIARHGSFSRAAQALNLTQPAVSMQVRHLEEALGLPLLERVGKRAFPTRAGELLLAHADRALRELEAGVERVQQLRGVVAGRVRLGTSASISIYLLPPALRRFRVRYPETEVVIVTGNAAEITRAVVANTLDVGDREPAGARPRAGRDARSSATSWWPSRPPEPAWRRHAARRRADAGAAPADPLRGRRHAPPGHRRLVPPGGRGAALADGARQHGGDQEAGRGRARPVGHLVVLGEERGAGRAR